MVVLLICWQQIARKHGSTQERKKPCRKWYAWLEKMKKEDEKRKMEEMHQQRANQMIKSAEGLLYKITKPRAWRRRSGDLEERRRGRKAFGPL